MGENAGTLQIVYLVQSTEVFFFIFRTHRKASFSKIEKTKVTNYDIEKNQTKGGMAKALSAHTTMDADSELQEQRGEMESGGCE